MKSKRTKKKKKIMHDVDDDGKKLKPRNAWNMFHTHTRLSICVHFEPCVVHFNSTSSIYTSLLSSLERNKCTLSSKVRGILRARAQTHMVHLPFYHLRLVRRLHSTGHNTVRHVPFLVAYGSDSSEEILSGASSSRR